MSLLSLEITKIRTSFWCFIAVATAVCPAVAAEQPGQSSRSQTQQAQSWRVAQGKIHGDLEKPEPAPNLATPQATVEYFVRNAKARRFEQAAYTLNLELYENMSAQGAAELAKQLFYVLNQKLWIDWEGLPDRRDGMREGSLFGSSPMAGAPLKNISLGTIDAGYRVVSIRVQRVKTETDEPVWLFSAQTVENIPALYDQYGPSWLARQFPNWARERGVGRIPLWQLIFGAIVLVTALGAGLLVWFGLSRYKDRRKNGNRAPLAPLAERVRLPVSLAISVLILYVSKEAFLRLTGPVSQFVEPLLLLAVVATLTAVVSVAGSFILQTFARGAITRHATDGSDEQRRLLTQVSIARRVFILVMALIAIGIFLIELQIFETVGIALLASAGAGGVILGLAGQTVLGNLMAGVQIAITQPFRIDDSVFIEDNWGRIEEITYTYVVIRTWDHRRLIFPVKYFLEHYIENWSKTHRFLIKPIYLHVDYRLNVQTLRDKFFDLLQQDDDWQETDDSYVAVVDTNDETMVVRLTAGAADPSTAWFLSLRLRENIVAWLQQYEDGRYLPRQRISLLNGQATKQSGASTSPNPQNDRRDASSMPTATHGGDGGDDGY
jgi:small-conductance mechanosensitive channel